MKFNSEVCGQCPYRLYPLTTGDCPQIKVISSSYDMLNCIRCLEMECLKKSGVIEVTEMMFRFRSIGPLFIKQVINGEHGKE